jgi:cytochrome c-type biogenesis protein CcmE
MSRRRKRKVIVALVVIAAALVVVFWGWSSTGGQNYLSVSDIANSPSQYSGKAIEVRGVVSGWNGDPGSRNFTLTDTNPALGGSINVTVTGTLPSGFENGKTIAAKGQLDSVRPLNMTATELTVGCASKY